MRTAKLKIKSKKFKKTKSKKVKKSKKMKGGSHSQLPQIQLPQTVESGNLSQSFGDVCETSRCVSCRYFAMKAYFLKIGYTLKDMEELFEKYDRGDLNKLAKRFNPNELGEQPDFSPIFITLKDEQISSPRHACIIVRKIVYETVSKKRKKVIKYSIHGSWAQSRAAKEEEWLNYVEEKKKLQTEYVNWDEFYVDEIAHTPTTQRSFSETELTYMLSHLDNPEYLQTLFGLTDAELDCVNIHELKNVVFYRFNPTRAQIDDA